ncbi:MAG: anti-sigma factor antagonist [Acidobacteria bacterium]|nr:anti-sigma factor antagonist [Acidobacteriota bacterium]
MNLELDSRVVGRVSVVKCRGRIVAGAESNALAEHVRKLQPEFNHFVLHLGDVHFIDSTGLGLIVRLLSSLRSVRGDLKLCAVPGTIQTILQLTKLSPLFDTHSDEESALSAFHQRTALGAHVSDSAAPVLCIEKSSDLLALLREVLRRAGFEPLTTTNFPDAMVLLKSAKPRLAIVGPGALAGAQNPVLAFRKAASEIPVIEIEAEYAVREPHETSSEILSRVQSALGKGAHA